MPQHDPTRRGFLDSLTVLLLLIIGLLMLIPIAIYLLAPLRRRAVGDESEVAFSDAGPLADIPVGQWLLIQVEVVRQDGWKKTRVKQAIWVRREGGRDEDIRIMSPICPHLGCPVNWHPDRKEFICPCHGGVFDAMGAHVAGPPPRNLDPLSEFKVINSHLWVRWQDFKIGVADRVPVSI